MSGITSTSVSYPLIGDKRILRARKILSPFSIGEKSKTVQLYKHLIKSEVPKGAWLESDEALYVDYMQRQQWEVFCIALHSEGVPLNWLVL